MGEGEDGHDSGAALERTGGGTQGLRRSWRRPDPPQDPAHFTLEEALLKFAETVACDAEIDQVLATLEPHQLGAGTPDGTVLLVNVLRMWLSADERPALADGEEDGQAGAVMDAPLYFSKRSA